MENQNEQELRERIAKEMYISGAMSGNATCEQASWEWDNDSVLDREDYLSFAIASIKVIKEANYVRLADDQSLPVLEGHSQSQIARSLKHRDWRKVES